jgi:NAD(P)-dependent dehydrogenase (short-subunit alcohol dehydrogenase family)
LEELAAECGRDGNDNVPLVQTDVSTKQQGRRLAVRAIEKFGCIDPGVNNAGVMLLGRFEDAPMQVGFVGRTLLLLLGIIVP